MLSLLILLAACMAKAQSMIGKTWYKPINVEDYSPYRPQPVSNMRCGNGTFDGKVYKSNGYPASGITRYADNSYYSGSFSESVYGQWNGGGIYKRDIQNNSNKIAEAFWGNWVNGQLQGSGSYAECVKGNNGYEWRAYNVTYQNNQMVGGKSPILMPENLYGVYFPSTNSYNSNSYSSPSPSYNTNNNNSNSNYNRHEATCMGCNKTGKCRHCNGTGQVYVTNHYIKCSTCHGTGVCRNCMGSGVIHGNF